jgi:hypothetical protein
MFAAPGAPTKRGLGGLSLRRRHKPGVNPGSPVHWRMPLIASTLELPPDTQELRAGDLDGDGRDELIVVSRTPRSGAPDTVRLTLLHFAPNGTLAGRRELDLGARAMWWDVDHGLWVVDKEGLARLDPESGETLRLARFSTALSGLGPTTPAWAPLAHDLDGDDKPELVAWSAGKYLAFRADGTAFGSVPAPATGSLGLDWETGGARTRATATPPPLSVADLDADGRADLLLVAGARLLTYYSGADGVGARAATLTLPLDLDPPEEDPRPGETRRRIAAVWIEDIDGDRRADLAVQRIVLAGSWWGATAELTWAKGRGDGFGTLTTIPLNAAAFGVELFDVDADGDKDFVAPLVDIGIGTVARALVARSARVDLTVYRMGGGAFAAPQVLRVLGFPLENPGRFQASFEGDIDGDRRRDMVTNDGEDRVRVYRGTATGLESAAAFENAVRVPTGDETLFVHDLTGDGRAEIVVWGPKERSATLLRVP